MQLKLVYGFPNFGIPHINHYLQTLVVKDRVTIGQVGNVRFIDHIREIGVSILNPWTSFDCDLIFVRFFFSISTEMYR